MAERRGVRCAIYTRKSTEDGLDQEFNSLDAQHEACAAYITSQRHEGWTLHPARYDDGGFSGGSMQRPGLKRLLGDIEAGLVDVIVVYKVDRLTRSLADFAKIVEILDHHQASFVSITQAFNTTTSMGRLTLNVLLSFAQFEREVTGERIRDKIAASKRKGLWMGGPVPLGYVVRDRKLVVDETEAEQVRRIMQRYLALGSVRELVEDLAAHGAVTKVQQRTSGPHRGGVPFARGALFHLLQNRIYHGEIVHKGTAHLGEHAPIVPLDLWEAVQAKLAQRGCGSSERLPAQHPSLFIGMVVDGLGRAMTPSHATKQKRRYRYYVTRPDLVVDGQPAWRVAAHDLERLVLERIADSLGDRLAIHDLVTSQDGDVALIDCALRNATGCAEAFRAGKSVERRRLAKAVVHRIALHEHHLTLSLSRSALLAELGCIAPRPNDDQPLELDCPTVRVRKGHELRLVILGRSEPAPTASAGAESFATLLREADAARALVFRHPDRTLVSIAAEGGRCRSRLTKLVALSCLAPDLVMMLLEGRQPSTLTAAKLLASPLPLAWSEQRSALGVA